MVVDLDSARPEEDDPPALKSPESLIDWLNFHRSPPGDAASPPFRMVAIRDFRNNHNNDPPIIFPPVNHENLHIHPEPPPIRFKGRVISYNDSDTDSGSDFWSDSNSTSTFSPSDSSPAPRSPLYRSPKLRPAAPDSGWFETWAEILHSKLSGIARYIRCSLSFSGWKFPTFPSVAAMGMVIAILCFRQRRRLRAAEERGELLIGTVRERDEKIKQLLDQISRMNQLLLSLHHRQPNAPTA